MKKIQNVIFFIHRKIIFITFNTNFVTRNITTVFVSRNIIIIIFNTRNIIIITRRNVITSDSRRHSRSSKICIYIGTVSTAGTF